MPRSAVGRCCVGATLWHRRVYCCFGGVTSRSFLLQDGAGKTWMHNCEFYDSLQSQTDPTGSPAVHLTRAPSQRARPPPSAAPVWGQLHCPPCAHLNVALLAEVRVHLWTQMRMQPACPHLFCAVFNVCCGSFQQPGHLLVTERCGC